MIPVKDVRELLYHHRVCAGEDWCRELEGLATDAEALAVLRAQPDPADRAGHNPIRLSRGTSFGFVLEYEGEP